MRTKTYDFKSFMDGKHHEVVKKATIPKFSLIPLAVAPLFTTTLVNAEASVPVVGSEIRDKMMTAFEPLIGLIQGMAYPVAMVVVLGGAIFVMIGNSDKGFGMMQKAGLGYLLVMIAPMILDVLVDSMKGIV